MTILIFVDPPELTKLPPFQSSSKASRRFVSPSPNRSIPCVFISCCSSCRFPNTFRFWQFKYAVTIFWGYAFFWALSLLVLSRSFASCNFTQISCLQCFLTYALNLSSLRSFVPGWSSRLGVSCTISFFDMTIAASHCGLVSPAMCWLTVCSLMRLNMFLPSLFFVCAFSFSVFDSSF